MWDTLAAAVGGGPAGVIDIDNAQWLDEASLVLLRYGLRRLAGRPLLMLAHLANPGRPPARPVVAAAREPAVRSRSARTAGRGRRS